MTIYYIWWFIMINDLNNNIFSDKFSNIFQKHNWKKIKISQDSLFFNRNGIIADYYLSISYKNERLFLECVLDMDFPESIIIDIYKLINKINDKSYDGYFTYDQQTRLFKYKDSVIFANKFSNTSLHDILDFNLSVIDELVECFTLSIHKLIYTEITVEEISQLMFVKALGHA